MAISPWEHTEKQQQYAERSTPDLQTLALPLNHGFPSGSSSCGSCRATQSHRLFTHHTGWMFRLSLAHAQAPPSLHSPCKLSGRQFFPSAGKRCPSAGARSQCHGPQHHKGRRAQASSPLLTAGEPPALSSALHHLVFITDGRARHLRCLFISFDRSAISCSLQQGGGARAQPQAGERQHGSQAGAGSLSQGGRRPAQSPEQNHRTGRKGP